MPKHSSQEKPKLSDYAWLCLPVLYSACCWYVLLEPDAVRRAPAAAYLPNDYLDDNDATVDARAADRSEGVRAGASGRAGRRDGGVAVVGRVRVHLGE